MSSELSANRKDDHIRLAMEQQNDAPEHQDFDDVEFIHHALSGVNIDEVSLPVTVGNMLWKQPFYINAMTGGTETAARVNAALAEAAAHTGTTVSSGSVSIALDNPELANTFRVLRTANPNGTVIANIGAGRSIDDAKRAIDLLEADALQVHLNAVQETVMPEGSRNFGDWRAILEEIVHGLDVPIIVKEVGFGISRRTLEQLRDIGVEIADVSGSGGTNFARIEGARRDDGFDDLTHFGQSAVACLLDAPEFPTLLASGGVRSPIDAVRSLALGAKAVGIAGRVLRVAINGDSTEVVKHLEWWQARIAELCALLGATTPAALGRSDLLLRGHVREFCELRGIDAAAYSRRSR
ncbi:MAG: type 2 isopentenyl-diphosphate Delta-isomerase [Canibacter sp.]